MGVPVVKISADIVGNENMTNVHFLNSCPGVAPAIDIRHRMSRFIIDPKSTIIGAVVTVKNNLVFAIIIGGTTRHTGRNLSCGIFDFIIVVNDTSAVIVRANQAPPGTALENTVMATAKSRLSQQSRSVIDPDRYSSLN